MRCRFSTENTTYLYPQGFWSPCTLSFLVHPSWTTNITLSISPVLSTSPHWSICLKFSFSPDLASRKTGTHLEGKWWTRWYQHDLSCQCRTCHLRALLHESNTLRTHLTPCVGFSLAIYALLLDPRELSIVNNRACDLAWAHLRVTISQCELKIHWAILWDN